MVWTRCRHSQWAREMIYPRYMPNGGTHCFHSTKTAMTTLPGSSGKGHFIHILVAMTLPFSWRTLGNQCHPSWLKKWRSSAEVPSKLISSQERAQRDENGLLGLMTEVSSTVKLSWI